MASYFQMFNPLFFQLFFCISSLPPPPLPLPPPPLQLTAAASAESDLQLFACVFAAPGLCVRLLRRQRHHRGGGQL